MSKSSRQRYRKLKGETALDDDEEDEDEIDRLTVRFASNPTRTKGEADSSISQSTDAYMFPLIGSVVLLTLYGAFKYLDKAMVNKILSGYFIFMQTGALARVSPPSPLHHRSSIEK